MSDLIFYFLVILIGFLGSFIGTIGAGAGIVVFSGLTFLGFPAQIAIATDTFGSIGFRLGSFYNYVKYGKVVWNLIVPLTIFSILGSIIGASILVSFNENLLSKFVGVILLFLLPTIFLKKDVGVVEFVISKTRRLISHFFYFLVEVWSAFFPPGSGFLGLFVMTRGYGMTILQVKGTRRIPALIAEITATVIFFMAGIVDVKVGMFLIFGGLIGSYIGSHIAIKKGDLWIKPIMVFVIVLVSLKMIFF